MTKPTASEWLLEQGYVKEITRGRRSLENIERLNNALSEGVEFLDWPKSDTVVTMPGKKKETKTVKAQAKPVGKQISVEPERSYPDGAKVYSMIDGKRVYGSMKEVCQYCSVSLSWCKCAWLSRTPRAIVGGTYRDVVITL